MSPFSLINKSESGRSLSLSPPLAFFIWLLPIRKSGKAQKRTQDEKTGLFFFRRRFSARGLWTQRRSHSIGRVEEEEGCRKTLPVSAFSLLGTVTTRPPFSDDVIQQNTFYIQKTNLRQMKRCLQIATLL